MLIRSIKQFKILHNLNIAEHVNKGQAMLVLRYFFLVYSSHKIPISKNHPVFLPMPSFYTPNFNRLLIPVKVNQ